MFVRGEAADTEVVPSSFIGMALTPYCCSNSARASEFPVISAAARRAARAIRRPNRSCTRLPAARAPSLTAPHSPARGRKRHG
ncbi:hypothetical protein GPICK_04945 [Geobacter pickeringii]|uniref:Uncharacterized protein n=1 Tax=Geobacter pickeringii TaxID=345632 RepID=A0A0B5B8B1_9BACT|nr:hypothetical protein GPICK_04945 [Geobacter pickeringii]